MNEFFGSAANRITSTTSSISATRFIGTPRVRSAIASASLLPVIFTKSATMAVRVKAGQTALTRMPLVAYSAAAERVRPTTACLAAA